MSRIVFAAADGPGSPSQVTDGIEPFPADFRTRDIPANGTTLHVRVGGAGPAVILLHGYGETGDMWGPMAAELARDHTIVVPDLRGMGLSSRPAGSYDKETQGQDIAGLLDALNIQHADLVTHDIGNMVGYAFAADNPGRVTRFVIMDAPLPGVRMQNGWWRDGSASTSIVSGTNFQPIRNRFVRRRVSITPGSTHSPGRCTPASTSSRRSIRTRSTTRLSSPRAS
jgi:pimeloyl-ACP methyl ester carboxylesterase